MCSPCQQRLLTTLVAEHSKGNETHYLAAIITHAQCILYRNYSTMSTNLLITSSK